MKRFVVGVDLGTSGCKVAMVDAQMNVVATSRQTYAEGSCAAPHLGWVDQDPDAWMDAVRRGIREVTSDLEGGRVEAISFSAQMHGLIALDAQGRLLRPCITCADSRSERQCGQIYALLGGPEQGRSRLLAGTNNYMFPSFTATKILWMQENEPELFARAAVVLNPKDYLRFRMTGVIATDVSDACGYGIYDCRNDRWNREITDALGIPAWILPEVLESDAIAGRLTEAEARALGLPSGIPVIAGGGDAVVQTTGSGAVAPGAFSVTLGTGALIGASFLGFRENPHGTPQMFRSNSKGRYMAFGGTGSGGGALAWLRDALLPNESYDALNALAEAVPAGAQGLRFYPMLVGQRCPYEDEAARGCYIGIRPEHGKGHFVRSLMEGVALCLRDNYDWIRPMCGEIEGISVTGGGAASDLWCQICADVFGVEAVRYTSYKYGGAIGACMIAGCGAGIWRDLAEAAAGLRVERAFAPDGGNHEKYQRELEIYRTFYPALKASFAMMMRQDEE